MFKKDSMIITAAGAVFFLLTGLAYFMDYFSEWRSHQKTFMAMAEEKLSPEIVSNLETGILQIWNPELKVTDRCVTCHMGIQVPGFEDAPQPYTTHPDLKYWEETHSFKDYGCTTCHGGQGYATRAADAHGEMKHWEQPLLSKKLAESYGFEKSAGLMEANCNVCHRRDTETDRMPHINLAKKLIQERGCIACHVMDGKNGGNIGPELTYIGGKHGEHFSMEHVQGKHSVFQWHLEHFKMPASVSPGSVMPPVAFTDEEARALSLLMMSWQKKTLPFAYLPYPNRNKPEAEE